MELTYQEVYLMNPTEARKRIIQTSHTNRMVRVYQ
jgi:hypothetical protein